MKRKLLFILRHEETRDDLKYIARIAQYSALAREPNFVNLKVLFLHSSYLKFEEPTYCDDPDDVKLDLDLQRILNSGAEVAYDERLYYPRWEGPYDLNIPGTRDYAASYGRAVRFRESGIILVDPYEYVANAVKNGFEIIKW